MCLHGIPEMPCDLAVWSLSHAHETRLMCCTGVLRSGQAECCCAHFCCGAAVVGASLLAKGALGVCEMGKKVSSPRTGPKAAHFRKMPISVPASKDSACCIVCLL